VESGVGACVRSKHVMTRMSRLGAHSALSLGAENRAKESKDLPSNERATAARERRQENQKYGHSHTEKIPN